MVLKLAVCSQFCIYFFYHSHFSQKVAVISSFKSHVFLLLILFCCCFMNTMEEMMFLCSTWATSLKHLPSLNFVCFTHLFLCLKRNIYLSNNWIQELHRHMNNYKSSLVLVLNVERHSKIMNLSVYHITCELNSFSIRKNVINLESYLIFAC